MADLALNFGRDVLNTQRYGDLLLLNGDLALTGGQAAIEGAIAQRLRSLEGEWFLDRNVGLPYLQELFGRRGPTEAFEAALQNAVLNTPGVVALLYWKTEHVAAERRLSLTFRAQTTSGDVAWSGALTPTAGGN